MHAPEPIEWRISRGLVPYNEALAFMETRVGAIAAGQAPECVWLLEHPPLYTAGTSSRPEDLLNARFPVYETGRGGQYTYHGPGQRVAYVMLDLRRMGNDVRRFVWLLEEWIIRTLSRFALRAERREGRVGLWIPARGPNGHEDKIAAIGIRVRRGISYHGVSLNVDPDLSHFDGIVPCGIQGHGVTSLAKLGLTSTMADADLALRDTFAETFERQTTLTPTSAA